MGCSATGAVVIEETNLQTTFIDTPGVDGGNLAITVQQDVAGTDPTGAFFEFVNNAIRGRSVNVDEGSDWYVVNEGNVFSREATMQQQFPVLIEFGSQAIGIPSDFISLDDPFYLGVATGLGDTQFLDQPIRDVFGWVRFVNGVPVSNAVAYGASGIIIGTSIAVPEPSTVFCLAGLCSAFIVRRMCRRESDTLDTHRAGVFGYRMA